MGKKKILYYTDCPFFAGCENMIANFFNSEELSKVYDVVLVYRYSDRYKEGAIKRMDMGRSIPVNLITEPTRDSIITSDNRIFARIQSYYRYLICFFIKYFSVYINYRRLLPLFREYAPDIIHINNGGYPAATSCFSAVLAAKKCKITNIVYVVNNMAMDYKHPLRWFDRGLDRIVKSQVRYFINGSNNAGIRLKEVLDLPDDKQITIRNGIIPREVSLKKDVFLQKYGIEVGTFVFAEVANLEVRKGHMVLLKAVQKLIKKSYEIPFVVVLEGNGPLKDQLSAYIINNSLSNYVRMIEVDQIYNLYNSIDVLVLPSLYKEDFPNTIIEAMGMGIPVIGTSIAGIPEQIDDHKTGILIPPGDEDALASAMEEILKDSELYTLCSREAKKKFESNYTASISVNNYLDLYNSMIN